jgi:hypothetical protein
MRMAAVGLPCTAFLAGRLAPRSRLASGIALAGGVIVAGSAAPLARAGRRAERSRSTSAQRGPTGALPWLSVIIPARDESAVIAALIGDLGRQDLRASDGSPRFDVTIVDDRSEDKTGCVAADALRYAGLERTSRVLRRTAPAPDGKGAALASVPLRGLRGEVIVVLDADARLEPDFLGRAARLMATGAEAMTARRRMLPPAEGRPLARLLAQVQDDEQTIDGEIQLGRWALGGASELRGNGMLIRTEALSALGGWEGAALCEDLELSTRLLSHSGHGVAWARDLEVWEEPILELRGLFRQRLRWAEGLARRDVRKTLPLLAGPGPGTWQRLDVVAYLIQSLTPFAAIGLLSARSRGGGRRLAFLASCYGVGAAALGYDALRWSAGPDGLPPRTLRRAARAVAVAAWSTLWLLVLPMAQSRVAFGRSELVFAKTVHRGGYELPRHGMSRARAAGSIALRPQAAADGEEDAHPRAAHVEAQQCQRRG